VNGVLDAFDVEIWKDKHCCYTKKLEKHAEIESQVFPIVLGQCHPALRERLQADDTRPTLMRTMMSSDCCGSYTTAKHRARLVVIQLRQ
jgi:hypothetical protein